MDILSSFSVLFILNGLPDVACCYSCTESVGCDVFVVNCSYLCDCKADGAGRRAPADLRANWWNLSRWKLGFWLHF